MKCLLIFLGLSVFTPLPASANAQQTPEELREKGFIRKKQEKARQNMEERMRAKDVIEKEKQEERQKEEQESLERDARDEMWGKQGPRYVP